MNELANSPWGGGAHFTANPVLKTCGVDWVFCWGQERNQAEVKLKELGFNVFFTVGSLSLDPSDANFKPISPEKRTEWTEIIPKLAKEYPGSIYQIGNEIDWYPFFKPEEYVVWFHDYSERIRSFDKTAKIMIGSLLFPVWTENNLRKDKDYEKTFGLVPDEEFGWIQTFWDCFLKKYSTKPQVDIWNIHLYPNRVPFEYKVKECGQWVMKFREFMGKVGEKDKPLWVTEFSSGGGIKEGYYVRNDVVHDKATNRIYAKLNPDKICTSGLDCLTDKEKEIEDRIEINFMDGMIRWFAKTNYVQKWFWFHFTNLESPQHPVHRTSDIYFLDEKTNKLNRLGEYYIKFKQELGLRIHK